MHNIEQSYYRISVIVPAYNEEAYIQACLASLQRQDYRGPFEIIVVDNASEDRTAAIASACGARVVYAEQRGYAAARGRGCAAASGDIIAMTDADSEVPQDWLSRLNEWFQRSPSVVAVGGMFHFTETSRQEDLLFNHLIALVVEKSSILASTLGHRFLCGFNMAFRRDAYERTGGFDTSLQYAEDLDIAAKLSRIGEVVLDPRLRVRTSFRRYSQADPPGTRRTVKALGRFAATLAGGWRFQWFGWRGPAPAEIRPRPRPPGSPPETGGVPRSERCDPLPSSAGPTDLVPATRYPLCGRRIVVTGGSGFIGRRLVQALAKQNQVLVLGRTADERFADCPNVKVQSFDVRRDDFVAVVAAADVVFHLAAHVDVPRSIAEPWDDFETNAIGTLRLLEALRLHGRHVRLVYASAHGVYGHGHEQLREDSATLPLSPYAASKLCADHYCRIYANIYGLKIMIIRYGTAFGPGATRLFVYDMLSKIESSRTQIELHGNGEQRRDLSYVENHVAGTLLLTERAAFSGEAYNLGSGDSVRLLDVAHRLRDLLRSPAVIRPTGVLRPGEAQELFFDISRAKQQGYRPGVSLDEGLARTVFDFQRSWVAGHRLPFVSVVIPTYNERENVEPTLERIRPWLEAVASQHEIVWVDDNSPDGTAAVIARLAARDARVRLLRRGQKAGIGAAHKAGIQAARGEVVITMDADLSQDPQILVPAAYHLQHGSRLVIGSRYLPGAQVQGVAFLKRQASVWGNRLARSLLRVPILDMTHSLRAFNRHDFLALQSQLTCDQHPDYLLQFTIAAYRAGLRITEIPVTFIERRSGQSKLALPAAGLGYLQALAGLLRQTGAAR